MQFLRVISHHRCSIEKSILLHSVHSSIKPKARSRIVSTYCTYDTKTHTHVSRCPFSALMPRPSAHLFPLEVLRTSVYLLTCNSSPHQPLSTPGGPVPFAAGPTITVFHVALPACFPVCLLSGNAHLHLLVSLYLFNTYKECGWSLRKRI